VIQEAEDCAGVGIRDRRGQDFATEKDHSSIEDGRSAMVSAVHAILEDGKGMLASGQATMQRGLTYHVHEHVGQHAGADLVVAPCLLQALEELLSGHAPLIGGGTANAVRIEHEIGREQLLDGGADLAAQPTTLEVVDLVVERLALFLEDYAIGVAVQFLVGQLGCILGVYLAEGGLDGGPRVFEIDVVAMEALCLRRGVS